MKENEEHLKTVQEQKDSMKFCPYCGYKIINNANEHNSMNKV
jgi:DNA-directed RNA polymerase subunit RPC12/RpoP